MVPSLRTTLLAATLLLLVLPAGCGGSDDDQPPTDTVAVGASVAPVDKNAFVTDLLAAIDAYDSVHLSVRAGTMGSGEVDLSYPAGKTLIHVDADIARRGPSEFVIADGVVYIEQTQGGKWSVLDGDDPSYGSLLTTFTKIGPHESVAGLGRGIISVTRNGSRTVDGAELTAYRLEVDPSRATGAFKALAGTSGISEALTFDFFVDDADLLRLVEAQVGGEVTTVALTAWGEPVTIVVPSADQLVGSG